jgi:hypothetical protein
MAMAHNGCIIRFHFQSGDADTIEGVLLEPRLDHSLCKSELEQMREDRGASDFECREVTFGCSGCRDTPNVREASLKLIPSHLRPNTPHERKSLYGKLRHGMRAGFGDVPNQYTSLI